MYAASIKIRVLNHIEAIGNDLYALVYGVTKMYLQVYFDSKQEHIKCVVSVFGESKTILKQSD
jgi:hypothetical protein